MMSLETILEQLDHSQDPQEILIGIDWLEEQGFKDEAAFYRSFVHWHLDPIENDGALNGLGLLSAAWAKPIANNPTCDRWHPIRNMVIPSLPVYKVLLRDRRGYKRPTGYMVYFKTRAIARMALREAWLNYHRAVRLCHELDRLQTTAARRLEGAIWLKSHSHPLESRFYEWFVQEKLRPEKQTTEIAGQLQTTYGWSIPPLYRPFWPPVIQTAIINNDVLWNYLPKENNDSYISFLTAAKAIKVLRKAWVKMDGEQERQRLLDLNPANEFYGSDWLPYVFNLINFYH